MTLDDRISALRALAEAGTTNRADLEAAEGELRVAIVNAVQPILAELCSEGRFQHADWSLRLGGGITYACELPSPRELATVLSAAIDRQLAGLLPVRVEEWRAHAVIMRALAGALRGLAEARAKKKR